MEVSIEPENWIEGGIPALLFTTRAETATANARKKARVALISMLLEEWMDCWPGCQ